MRSVALLALLLAACAGPQAIRGELHYGMDDAPEGKQLMWPAAPEVPRFLYTGTLTGERNFRGVAGSTSAWREFGRWIAGIDDKAPQPVVLQRPAAVTGDDNGRLFVSDTSRQAVFVFDAAAGELLVWERAQGLINFVAPVGLAVAPGRLFVADAELRAVFVLDSRGEPLASIGQGVLQRPTGVWRAMRSAVCCLLRTRWRTT